MTHYELLERVKFNQGYQMGLDGYRICSALRAVVEMHMPRAKGGLCVCGEFYPCAVIKVIEKEINGG